MKQIESTAIYTDHGKPGYVDLKSMCYFLRIFAISLILLCITGCVSEGWIQSSLKSLEVIPDILDYSRSDHKPGDGMLLFFSSQICYPHLLLNQYF